MNELNLPKEGSPEYYAKMRQIEEQIVNKFAWTAQHDGIVYKFDPAFKAMDDQTFNRVSRAEHSFLYMNRGGQQKAYFYRMQDVLCALDDPELDFGFIFAEVVEFRPGEGEITRDDLGRRVLICGEPLLSSSNSTHLNQLPSSTMSNTCSMMTTLRSTMSWISSPTSSNDHMSG